MSAKVNATSQPELDPALREVILRYSVAEYAQALAYRLRLAEAEQEQADAVKLAALEARLRVLYDRRDRLRGEQLPAGEPSS